MTELPSISISLFDSKTSENTNNSKTPDKSENLIIAYDCPFCFFFLNFKMVHKY